MTIPELKTSNSKIEMAHFAKMETEHESFLICFSNLARVFKIVKNVSNQ